MKVLLITPPYHAGVVESAGHWMPLSFAYLAGAVRAAGFDVEIYDAMTKQHTIDDIAQRLADSDADVVAVTAITSSLPASLEVLTKAKIVNPDVKTILGGVHPTFCYNDLFTEYPEILDVVVRGEGEHALPEIMQAWSDDKPLDDVLGAVFLRHGEIIVNKPRPFLDSLDNMPMAWDLFDWEDYRYFVIPDSRLASISTSRGCSHSCTFCSQQKFWEKTWRARDPQCIIDEIAHLKDTYAANVFLIVDEYPTSDRERWENFLDLLIERDMDIYLLLETRVEDIVRDEDIMAKYRQAGIIHIYIGVEATNQETLDLIKKDVSVEEGKKAIQLIREHGMISETSFVLGFEWETKESISRTLELAKHYDPDFAHFLTITPWPYADIYEDVKDRIEVWDYSKYNLVEPIIKPDAMTLDEVNKAIVSCYKQYYMVRRPIISEEKTPL